MIGPSYTKTAAGNIKPMRFVTIVGQTVDQAVQAGASTSAIWGISVRGVRNAPLASLDDGYLAISGQAFACFGNGDNGCRLVLGGTVVAGAYLTSDSDGRGISATAGGNQYVGAIALAPGNIGDEIPVLPITSYRFQ